VILNKESGLKGLTGFSDFRDLLAIHAGEWDKVSGDRVREMGREERLRLHKTVETALKMFVWSIKRYIGAYAAVLGGIDAVVFTAGIGQNCPQVRQWVLEGMGWMGIELDPLANSENRTVISRVDSRVVALAIPANEEVIIARETFKVASHHALVYGTRSRG
jgi:acetate kinase